MQENDVEIPERVQLQIGDVLDGYHLEASLGEGGFGSVYRVKQQNTGKEWALKLLRMWEIQPQDRKDVAFRFEREFEASQKSSKWLVHCVGKGKYKGNPYLLMEYCSGLSLKARMQAFHNEHEARRLALQLLEGLHDLHQAGIIHRDLKPENILFNSANDALLTDFGIAGFINKRQTQRNFLGHVQQIMGTIVYMPPEHLQGKVTYQALRPATDLFAFGVVVYEVLAGKGRLPFGTLEDFARNQVLYIEKIKSGKIIPLAQFRKGLHPVWQQLLEGCLHPDPNQRFRQAAEVKALFHEQSLASTPPNSKRTSAKLLLKVMNGDEVNRTYDLMALLAQKQVPYLTVGWLDEHQPHQNDLGIREVLTQYISRFHAVLEFDASQQCWYVRDGQFYKKPSQPKSLWHPSTNGTWLNGQEVSTQGEKLHLGDIVMLGDCTIKVLEKE